MVKKDFNYFFLKGNKYFFRSCKEMETIFYHYAENHVEELKFRNECVVSGNEFNEFILRKFDYNLGRIYRPFLDRKSTRLNSSHRGESRMPSSA